MTVENDIPCWAASAVLNTFSRDPFSISVPEPEETGNDHKQSESITSLVNTTCVLQVFGDGQLEHIQAAIFSACEDFR